MRVDGHDMATKQECAKMIRDYVVGSGFRIVDEDDLDTAAEFLSEFCHSRGLANPDEVGQSYFTSLLTRFGIMGKVTDADGDAVDYESAVELMDDDLREELCDDLTPCTAQEFFDEYARRHRERFGEDFAPYAGDAW